MKKIMICLFIIINFILINAESIGVEKAEKIAKNWFNEHCNHDRNSIEVINFYTERIGENILYYIFNFRKGFVIVSADDNSVPIIGYSSESNFDQENLPPALEELLSLYKTQMEEIISRKLKADDQIKTIWRRLLKEDFQPNRDFREVAPLITAKWGQGWPYRKFCPELNGSHAAVGCVAVAMGQVMHYWSHAEQGYGSHCYTPSNPDYGEQCANFGETTYNWVDMPDSLSGSPTEEEIDAVAMLLYHVGVSVDMDYGASSSANTGDCRTALITYFNYDDYAFNTRRANYTDQEWEDMLTNELDNGRPIIYSGESSGAMRSGHAYDIDGYQGSEFPLYYHVNWGWSGSYNGYFLLDNMNPGGGSPYENQNAVIMIQPEQELDLSVLIRENFETFVPPLFWTETILVGNDGWNRRLGIYEPYAPGTPENGAYYTAEYNSFNYPDGDEARLETMELDFSGMYNMKLSFWMHHDLMYSYASEEGIQVQVNEDSKRNWLNIGDFIPRYDGTEGWTEHIIDLSDYDNRSGIKVGILAHSQYGQSINIDLLQIFSENEPPFIEVNPVSFSISIPSGTSTSEILTIGNSGENDLIYTATAVCENEENTVLLEEDFNSGFPADWAIIDGFSDNETWELVSDYNSNTLDGTPFMLVDSDEAGYIDMDEILVSAIIETRTYEDIILEFDQYFRVYSGNESGDIDVWDGENWQNVYSVNSTTGDWSSPDHQAIYISEYMNPDLHVRFHYYNANYDWFWALDNITISGIPTDMTWLQLDGENSTQGTISCTDPDDVISVSFDATNLETGNYEANILISHNAEDSPFIVNVDFEVTSAQPESPENVNIEIIDNAQNVRITWTNEGYTYNIYSSDEPYTEFPDSAWILETTVSNTGEVIIPIPSGERKFYIVTAEN